MKSDSVAKLREWHEELINFLIIRPDASIAECAKEFGVSMSWIVVVKNSDAFKERLAQRQDEHFSRVSTALVSKVEALAEVAVDEMSRRLDTQKDLIPLSQLKEISDSALKALGFGARNSYAPPTQPVQTNIYIGDREVLASARERMASLRAERKLNVIEGDRDAGGSARENGYATEEQKRLPPTGTV